MENNESNKPILQETENKENTDITETEPKEEKQEAQKKKKASEHKIRGKKRLFADYQYADVKKKNGKTVRRKVYKGMHYGYRIPKSYKKSSDAFLVRIKGFYAVILLALIVLWLCPLTMLNSQAFGYQVEGVSLTYAYVFLPHMIGALPILLMLMTVIELLFTKGNRHELAFAEALTKNLRGQTIMSMICAIIAAISEAVFIIINRAVIASILMEASVIVILAGIVAVCVFWLKLQDSLPMEDVK